MKQFAQSQIDARLSRVLFEIRRMRHGADEEAVHDLRVALRRLFAALRIFRGLFPPKHAGRMRQQLRSILKLAGEVRNRDIALALTRQAGVGPRAAVRQNLQKQRQEAAGVLRHALLEVESRDVARRWRKGVR